MVNELINIFVVDVVAAAEFSPSLNNQLVMHSQAS